MGSFSVWHWLLIALLLLPDVLYLLSLQPAMKAVDAELRPMPPGLVWLLLIPLVNIVCMFFVVGHLRTGYAKISAAGQLAAASDGAYGVGLALAICTVARFVPFLGMLTSAVPVPWIVHWIHASKARGLVTGGWCAGVTPPLNASADAR